MPSVHDDVDSSPHDRATLDARVPPEFDVAAPNEQLAFASLPSMADLDALQVDLDEIDRVLSDLDAERPNRRVNEAEASHRA